MARILWLAPTTPDNVSVGRGRIAAGLEDRGHSVELEQAGAGSIGSLRGGHDAVVGTTRAGAIIAQAPVGDAPLVVDHVDPIRQFYETDHPLLAAGVDAAERLAFRRADAVLFCYEEERARVERHASGETIRTGLGVDHRKFEGPQGPSPPGRVLDSMGVDDGFAVYTGTLSDTYHVEELVVAGEESGHDLVICGEGPLRPFVEDAAAMSDSVHYIGSFPHRDVPALLDRAGCGVALVDDPHTVKVLEYSAAGLPIVHSRGRAESEYDAGVRFTSTDPEGVAASINYAIEHMQGTTRYAKRNPWDGVVDDYERALEAVL